MTVGPYAAQVDSSFLTHLIALSCSALWTNTQIITLSNSAAEKAIGPPGPVLDAYFQDWINRDGASGALPKGTGIKEVGEELRSRYLVLAQRARMAGDDDAAAIYAKTAYETLQPKLWFHHASNYTLLVPTPFADEPAGEERAAAAIARGIAEEFADCLPYWPRIEARRSRHRAKLALLADEGLAVWYEFFSSYLLWQRLINPLVEFPSTPADILSQYEELPESHPYVRGFGLVEEALTESSFWLFGCPVLAVMIIMKPMFLAEQLMPISDFESISPSDSLAPNERLRRISSTLQSCAPDSQELLETVFDCLDGYETGLLTRALGILDVHERSYE